MSIEYYTGVAMSDKEREARRYIDRIADRKRARTRGWLMIGVGAILAGWQVFAPFYPPILAGLAVVSGCGLMAVGSVLRRV